MCEILSFKAKTNQQLLTFRTTKVTKLFMHRLTNFITKTFLSNKVKVKVNNKLR